MSRFNDNSGLSSTEILTRFNYRGKGLVEPQHMRDFIASAAAGIDTTATASEITNACDVSSRVQELTATGTVTAGVQSLELNHATTAIDATLADSTNHEGLFIVKNTSASGTAGHNLTLTSGTFDGTNNKVVFDAPNDALVVYFDSAGNGTILVNVGSAVLSAV